MENSLASHAPAAGGLAQQTYLGNFAASFESRCWPVPTAQAGKVTAKPELGGRVVGNPNPLVQAAVDQIVHFLLWICRANNHIPDF